MTSFASHVANGKSEASGRDTLDTFRRYSDVFGSAFQAAVRRAERRGVRAPARVPEPRVVERTVVRDSGWREKAQDARAQNRAAASRATRLARDRDAAHRLAEERERKLAEAVSDARAARAEKNRMKDRWQAAEDRIERLRDELDEARGATVEGAERAKVSDLVRDAEARVERAELRATRAERESAEHGAAVTGELRRLGPAELAALRVDGPAGPAVLAAALKRLARVRSEGARQPLDAALLDVARAALHWRERL